MNGNLTDTPGVYGPDYVSLKFRNGSQFDVKNPTASFIVKAIM